MTVSSNGKPQGSSTLVPTCDPAYDGRLAHWYQNFETTPTNPRTPREKLKFVYKNQNELGHYEIYYLDKDNKAYDSETLMRR